jgi:hypothetical protein
MRRFAALALAGGVLALGAGWVVSAQTNESTPPVGETSGGPAPPGVPVIQAPPEPATPPVVSPPASNSAVTEDNTATNAPAKPVVAAKPPPPVTPVRSPAAVLQALDKVTAETIRFAAPVNQRIRYKNLVFTVKACESTGLDGPEPQFSAYVLINLQPPPVAGQAPPTSKQIYHGWMFSNSPGLHPLQHPIYDAWLISCSAAVPPA